MLLISTNHDVSLNTLQLTDVPSWAVCIWVIPHPALSLMPGCTDGRTAVRRGSRNKLSERNSLPSAPALRSTKKESRCCSLKWGPKRGGPWHSIHVVTSFLLLLLTPLAMGSSHSSSPIRDRAWIAFPNAATHSGVTRVQNYHYAIVYICNTLQHFSDDNWFKFKHCIKSGTSKFKLADSLAIGLTKATFNKLAALFLVIYVSSSKCYLFCI